jgi:cbb3-type cytochrome oxidase maturation protein
MEVLYILLPVAVVLATVAVGVFIWAARSGQFDDLETPGLRVLHDDEPRVRQTLPRGERGR